jgi:hypothetical protein
VVVPCDRLGIVKGSARIARPGWEKAAPPGDRVNVMDGKRLPGQGKVVPDGRAGCAADSGGGGRTEAGQETTGGGQPLAGPGLGDAASEMTRDRGGRISLVFRGPVMEPPEATNG